MSNSKNTSTEYEINYVCHHPWAHMLFQTKLPSPILEQMRKLTDEILVDPKRIDWGSNLAGQVRVEPLIPPKALRAAKLLDFFGNMISVYISQCMSSKRRQSGEEGLSNIPSTEAEPNPVNPVTIQSMWIVEQQPGEYNPMHVHTNCDISAVMYLNIPKFLESEKPERADDGSIYFVGDSGPQTGLTNNTLKIVPEPGDFFIFPSHMIHTVYPYKTNDTFARRSVSFNAKMN